jgi:SH3-like domain-containing protein
MSFMLKTLAAAAVGLAPATVAAQEGARPEVQRRGPETNLPLPRYVSLNVERATVRRGPGVSHRIDWVFLRRGEPLQVTAEHGHWRRVRDADAAEGWVHHSMLRSTRTAVVIAEPEAQMRRDPREDGALVARLETGVTGRLSRCGRDWCRMEAGGLRGWVPKADLWGAEPDETFD